MQQRANRHPTRRTFKLSKVRLGLMLFSLLAVIGLTVDLVSLRLRATRALKEGGVASLATEAMIEVTTTTRRWHDPSGRYSIKWPATWQAAGGEGGTYGVTLRGPLHMELSVSVRAAEPGGLEALRLRLGVIETNLNLMTRIQADTFQERPAWRRTMPLQKSTVEALDFIQGEQAVHVLMAAPSEAFAELRAVLVELRDSLDLAEGQEAR